MNKGVTTIFGIDKKQGQSSQKGLALIIIVFIMMVLAALGMVLTSLQSTRFATARAALRETQAFYIGEVCFSRATELLYDNPTGFKGPSRLSPWGADPSDPSNNNKGYFTETMTVQGVQGHFNCYAEQAGSNVILTIESAMDVTEQ
ncbi:MAG: hypothetical protein JW844_00195 [Candidatus Omnitrophica bacterium]|nr:hypothetical protein [Candidatus Omnitrophota bacterium]